MHTTWMRVKHQDALLFVVDYKGESRRYAPRHFPAPYRHRVFLNLKNDNPAKFQRVKSRIDRYPKENNSFISRAAPPLVLTVGVEFLKKSPPRAHLEKTKGRPKI